ncbi:MAG: transcription antiterminator, partial [Butyrivibrio sp.]|nr:transcription antiterminator [Butyrivibrio sp.]
MWYVIQVSPSHEHEVLVQLDKFVKTGNEEFFIMRCLRYLRQKDASWDNVEALAFPGYIFAKTDDINYLRERLIKVPYLTK